MVKLDTTCFLDSFRKFMVSSTCKSFIPQDYEANQSIIPERSREQGTMYVEAEDKVTLDKVQDITFVEVSSVLGIIYNSKSGHTQLKWRHVKVVFFLINGAPTKISPLPLHDPLPL